MKYAHLFNAFYNQPWHLRPDLHASFGELLVAHLQGKAIDGAVYQHKRVTYGMPNSRPIVGPVDRETGNPLIPQMEVSGPVAIIPVHGVLGRKLSSLALFCGGCDYDHITQFVEMAENDSSISHIIFDFDSPGGAARGAPECAERVAALTSSKQTIGYTEEQCCSAAYFLASQCGEIYAAKTAVVGSIGTLMAAVDSSRAWEMQGLKLELFTSSPKKGTGLAGRPFTEEDRAYLNERMSQADTWFKGAVKRGRPEISDEALEGQWFYAEHSQHLGVVDGIAASLEEVVAAAIAAA